MKKSCPAKESKVVTTKDAKQALNVSKEDPLSNLTEEQILINKKLLESGIEDEGLGWVEKTNIYKTINVSLDTAGSERLQRSSPRIAKAANSKAAKWVENSFESPKQGNARSVRKTKSSKKKKSASNRKVSSLSENKERNEESEESGVKANPQTESTISRDVETRSSSPKSSRKVHCVKAHVEENSKKECNASAEGGGQGVSVGKKRAPQPEVQSQTTPKKLKMEEANNGVSSEEESPLQVELEMEKRKLSEPFKVRDIKTIVSECELRNKKWKETYSRYKCPTRWGVPIVRNCSEKWDGKQIPPKLLLRFQKYLSSKDLTHPIFLPVKLQNMVDSNKLSGEFSPQSSIGTNSQCIMESENELLDSGEGSSVPVEFNRSGVENNLNASTSGKDTGERMVLRNRSQQKTVISDQEEFSSDDSDDWLVKQKSNKKQKVGRNKKAWDQNNKQLVLKLERCNLNKGNGQEGSRKNENKNDAGFTKGSVMTSNALNEACGNSKAPPDPDTMICPICSLRFKKQFIESHATECASKTYKD